MRRLIFGCGYLGGRVAQRWLAQNDTVYAITRSPHRADQMKAEGIQAVVADVTAPASLRELPAVDTALFAVGHDRSTPHSIEEVYVEGLRNALDALSPDIGRIVYVSSTGVYAQTDGTWVDEQSQTTPTRAGGKACLAAEQLLANHTLGPRATILRLAGIYGPGRLPNQQSLLAGDPLNAPSQGYLNLIHVDDAANVVLAAANVEGPRTYVISDGQPVLRCDYYRELARLLGAPQPRFREISNNPAAARASADKRVNNARMIRELGVELAYPSFKEGLREILSQQRSGPESNG